MSWKRKYQQFELKNCDIKEVIDKTISLIYGNRKIVQLIQKQRAFKRFEYEKDLFPMGKRIKLYDKNGKRKKAVKI